MEALFLCLFGTTLVIVRKTTNMKTKILTLITFLAVGLIANAQDQKPKVVLTPDGIPKLHLMMDEHDFGDINQGTQPEFMFTFVNEGSAPLVINDVKTPCSCTSPSYSKQEVAPGEMGEIKIKYNSTGRSGTFVKTVRVIYNSDQSPDFITIKGNVIVPQK
jgi:Protein of unknown function (DUF1573)